MAVSTSAVLLQKDQEIISDGQGGVIVLWDAYTSGTFYAGYSLYAQAIGSSGLTKWAAGGISINTAHQNNESYQGKIVSDGQGGAIITWYDNRSGNNDIYAQALYSTGSVRWSANGVSVCTSSLSDIGPQIVSDGQGGAIITWYRNTDDIFAQQISSLGLPQWKLSGQSICTAYGAQISPMIISDGKGGAIITWMDYRKVGYLTKIDDLNGDWDIYVQSINVTSNNVQNAAVTTADRQVKITWTNPLSGDYLATKILRRTDRYPTGPTDGTQVYWFNGTSCVDNTVANGKTYYYGLFAHSTSYQYASGVGVMATPNYDKNVSNVVVNQADKQISLSWSNPTGTTYLATKVIRRTDRYPTGPSDGTQIYWYNGDVRHRFRVNQRADLLLRYLCP